MKLLTRFGTALLPVLLDGRSWTGPSASVRGRGVTKPSSLHLPQPARDRARAPGAPHAPLAVNWQHKKEKTNMEQSGFAGQGFDETSVLGYRADSFVIAPKLPCSGPHSCTVLSKEGPGQVRPQTLGEGESQSLLLSR